MWTCIYLVYVLLLSANVKVDCGPHHGHDCHDKQCALVNEAVQNIGMYFDEHLCHAFKEVNCANHVLINDEKICGSDGQTYNNHCLYAKARCARVLNHHLYVDNQLAYPLQITNHGPCGSPTLQTQSTSVTTGSRSTSFFPSRSTPVSSGSTTTTAAATTKPLTTMISLPSTPATSTTTSTTTTPAMVSTTISTHNILGSVFCQYTSAIDCGSTLAVVCGSNGKFFANTCELLKEQCVEPTLRVVTDATHCNLSP